MLHGLNVQRHERVVAVELVEGSRASRAGSVERGSVVVQPIAFRLLLLLLLLLGGRSGVSTSRCWLLRGSRLLGRDHGGAALRQRRHRSAVESKEKMLVSCVWWRPNLLILGRVQAARVQLRRWLIVGDRLSRLPSAGEVLQAGNVAVITGASSGIGHSLSLSRCARLQMKVVLADVDASELEEAREERRSVGGEPWDVMAVPTDVRDGAARGAAAGHCGKSSAAVIS